MPPSYAGLRLSTPCRAPRRRWPRNGHAVLNVNSALLAVARIGFPSRISSILCAPTVRYSHLFMWDQPHHIVWLFPDLRRPAPRQPAVALVHAGANLTTSTVSSGDIRRIDNLFGGSLLHLDHEEQTSPFPRRSPATLRALATSTVRLLPRFVH